MDLMIDKNWDFPPLKESIVGPSPNTEALNDIAKVTLLIYLISLLNLSGNLSDSAL